MAQFTPLLLWATFAQSRAALADAREHHAPLCALPQGARAPMRSHAPTHSARAQRGHVSPVLVGLLAVASFAALVACGVAPAVERASVALQPVPMVDTQAGPAECAALALEGFARGCPADAEIRSARVGAMFARAHANARKGRDHGAR